MCTPQDSIDISGQSDWTPPSNMEMQEMLEERMERNGVGIVVGIVDSNGRRVVSHGTSSTLNPVPLDGDTLFQLGSLTKVLTTLLLSDMVLRNEVSLDDPAYLYLPSGIEISQSLRQITLGHLATHTSGLPSMPSNFDLNGLPDPYEAYSVDQLYEFLASYSIDQEPGEEWLYSNLGVSLLGISLLIIAQSNLGEVLYV